jgi:hypothetical protein
MATDDPLYPACPTRLLATVKGALKHALCGDESKPRYRQLVQPVDCRRCLRLEAEAPPEPPKPDAPAGPPSPEPPGLMRRAASYAGALAQWTAAGRPERSDKEVERIFHQFCKTCDWFDPDKQICRGCGCRVAEGGYAVQNKIKMATENCPRDLW